MAIAIVVAATAMAAAPAAIGNTEHALDRAHGAADAGAYRTADHTTHRAGDPVTFVGAFLRAAHDALRVPGMGHCEQREDNGGGRKHQPHGKADRKLCRLNPGFVHLDSLNSAAIASSGGSLKRPWGQIVAHL